MQESSSLGEAFTQLLPALIPLVIILIGIACKEAYDWMNYTRGNPVRTREEAIAEVNTRFEERRVPTPDGWIGLMEGHGDDAFVVFFRGEHLEPMQLDLWEKGDHRRLYGMDRPSFGAPYYTIHVESDHFVVEHWSERRSRTEIGKTPDRQSAMQLCIRYDKSRGSARRGLVEGIGSIRRGTSQPSY